MIALKAAFFLTTLAAVSARSSPIFKCTNKEQYAPCDCKQEKFGKYLIMDCNQVSMYDIMGVMRTVKANGKNILHIEISNDQTTRLPADLFGSILVIESIFNLPRLTSIDKNVFEGEDHLRYVDFSDTSMKEFPSEVVSSLKEAEVIYFSGSDMEGVLDSSTFSEVRNADQILRFKLANSKIFRIGPGTFENFKSLEHLSLANNLLKSIDATALPKQSLKGLDLSLNPLSEFPVNVIPKLAPGAWLNVEKTNTEFLEARTLNEIIQRDIIVDLKDNPLNCDCATFKTVAERLERNPYKYNVVGTCKAPAGIRQYKYVINLRPDDFPECSN